MSQVINCMQQFEFNGEELKSYDDDDRVSVAALEMQCHKCFPRLCNCRSLNDRTKNDPCTALEPREYFSTGC